MTPASLKRIKRHVLGKPKSFFVSTLLGMEHLCAEGLSRLDLSLEPAGAGRGGVFFSGRVPDCYVANLHLRTANRILMRVEDFTATNFRQLEKKLSGIDWELYLPENGVVKILAAARHSRLMHTDAIAGCVEAALRKKAMFWEPPLDAQGEASTAAQRIFIRGRDDRFTVSLDSSGELLHKRGLKTRGGTAPVRETIAAAVLMLAGYRPKEPLVDPMCGAGTFSLEAAMMAANIPPGWFREFAFMGWPCFKSGQWAHIRREAQNRITRTVRPVVFASDIASENCLSLEKIFQSVPPLADMARVGVRDFFELTPQDLELPPDGETNGLVVLNPPYGRRLGSKERLPKLIADIGLKLRKDFRGWRVALIVPDKSLIRQIPFPVNFHPLFHGGLKVSLLTGRIG